MDLLNTTFNIFLETFGEGPKYGIVTVTVYEDEETDRQLDVYYFIAYGKIYYKEPLEITSLHPDDQAAIEEAIKQEEQNVNIY